MAQLLRNHENSCFPLVGKMQYIVNKQQNANYVFYKYPFGFGGRQTFYTECPEFNSFVKQVNDDPTNQITIKCNGPFVDAIRTEIDIQKNMVTYTLDYYGDDSY